MDVVALVTHGFNLLRGGGGGGGDGKQQRQRDALNIWLLVCVHHEHVGGSGWVG